MEVIALYRRGIYEELYSAAGVLLLSVDKHVLESRHRRNGRGGGVVVGVLIIICEVGAQAVVDEVHGGANLPRAVCYGLHVAAHRRWIGCRVETVPHGVFDGVGLIGGINVNVAFRHCPRPSHLPEAPPFGQLDDV